MNSPAIPRGNELAPEKSLLVIRSGYADRADAIQTLSEQFFGEVLVDPAALPDDLHQRRIYACGDLLDFAPDGVVLRVIDGLSRGHEGRTDVRVIRQGQVPRSVHGLGVMVPALFEPSDFFGRISTEHTFQQLTESTKPGHALRTGIYLSEVTREGEALRFHLMRCSSNLTGPTDNLRAADRHILEALNEVARSLFDREVSLNHVLAQIYRTRRTGEKTKKARIGAHSDKTKDMHADGVMAFCSFYDEAALARLERSRADPCDRVYRKQSALMRLYFRRKRTVDDPSLAESFSVTLYPDSVFFMPLSTNRLYTHAIRPSSVDADRAPTRMGYVVRCSAQEAIFRDGQTFLQEGGGLIRLEPMDVEDARELRGAYREENLTDGDIRYGPVHFSMNAGDYKEPIV